MHYILPLRLRTILKRFSFPVAFALVSAISSGARAESRSGSDSAEAQRLFEEAKQVAALGRWKEACPLLAESLRLEPNMTTEFRLAACYEQIGRNAAAWTHYEATASAAAAAGQPTKERFARERAAVLQAKLDRIVIVPPEGAVVQVECDGRDVPRAAWSTALPLDPGEHTVHVWAPGMSSFDTLVTSRGEGRLVRIEVPPLEVAMPLKLSPVPNVPPPVVEQPQGPPAPSLGPLQPVPPSKHTSLKPLGLGMGIAGIVLMGTGTALYVDSRAAHSSTCGTSCQLGVGLLSVGGAAILVGAVLYITGEIER